MPQRNNERRLAGIVFRSSSEMDLISTLAKSEKRFSQLQKGLGMSTGNLNYHLVKLKAEGLVAKSEQGYTLSDVGRTIYEKYLRER